MIDTLTHEAVTLLKALIATPSFSTREENTAAVIADFLSARGVPVQRRQNNIRVCQPHYSNKLPTILLNSHHDTVRPNAGWVRDPFTPEIEGGRLYGLGSNDAGGALVSLLMTFLHFYQADHLPFNLVFTATAEEENSGENGIQALLPELENIALAIVGEPTEMALAVAERGLMVLDCLVKGRSGHAARDVGENAISKALQDIQWFHSYQFPNISETLGPVKMTVTMINAGTQHNVIPDTCRFTVDIRSTDIYPNAVLLKRIQQQVRCDIHPRSLKLNASSIALDHPVVQAAREIGMSTFASATTSDQAVIPAPSIKIGPGRSERSHTADEFIEETEIRTGIAHYIKLLNRLAVLMAAPEAHYHHSSRN